jgi:beta-N-acetylhexosaminidase
LSRLVPLVAAPVLLLAGCGTSPGTARSTTPPGTAAPTALATSASCNNDSALANWTVTKLAEQTVVVPVDETNVGSVADLVAAGAGGVILFGSDAPGGLGSDLASLVRQAPDGIQPLIMTDEEGGVVQRMANLVGDLPAARTMAATMSAAQIHDLAKQAGAKMRANGVTMDLAPVLDLDDRPGPSDSNPDGTRSFSKDRTVTQADGLAFAQGLTDAGVVPVVKHFPGLGGTTGNTDVVAAPTLPWSTLQQDGLLPFTAAINAGVPAVMIANATVPGLSTLPASLSPKVITDVLRQQLHFTGLVMTDSLSAGAIETAGYSIPTATVAALAAGADMILFTANDVPGTTHDTVQAIVSAVSAGTLSRGRLTEAVNHILAVKKINLCRP